MTHRLIIEKEGVVRQALMPFLCTVIFLLFNNCLARIIRFFTYFYALMLPDALPAPFRKWLDGNGKATHLDFCPKNQEAFDGSWWCA